MTRTTTHLLLALAFVSSSALAGCDEAAEPAKSDSKDAKSADGKSGKDAPATDKDPKEMFTSKVPELPVGPGDRVLRLEVAVHVARGVERRRRRRDRLGEQDGRLGAHRPRADDVAHAHAGQERQHQVRPELLVEPVIEERHQVRMPQLLERADLAMDTSNLLIAELAFRQEQIATVTRQRALLDALVPAIAALPGVEAVSPVTAIPFAGSGGWDGRFRIEGIRPGTVMLEALGQKPLAVARAEVHVSAGETREVELVLARATFFVVRTLDGALNDVAAEVEIEDARARVCRRLAGSVGNETLGPFEAGRTTVRARYGGREVEQVVELRGEAVREIELIFR